MNNNRPKRVPKEFLGAFKQGHRKNVQEFIDDDLAYELLDKVLKNNDSEARKALEWLTKYNNEVYRGVLKKNDPNAIHNTPELYKEATDAHNARRRDVYTQERQGMVSMEDHQEMESVDDPVRNQTFLNKNRNLNHEDVIIDLIDSDYGAKKIK